MNNIEELKKAALVALGGECTVNMISADLFHVSTIDGDGIADCDNQQQAEFIASASPTTILDLIAQLEAAHGSIKELESKVNHYVAAEYAHKHFDQTAEIIKRADSAELELVKVKAELSAANNGVTAENLRVIKMLLDVCGTAFELADDSCQQDVDGELCHVVPDSAFSRLSDALGEIENTLPDEYEDLPNIVLQWAAIPRHALQELFTAAPQPAGFTVEGNADAK